MQINKDLLKSFNPCSDRYKNYLKYYSEFNGSFDEFLDLNNISYDDKIWVAIRILNKNQLVHFGLLCAESVLYIFEKKYPNDSSVRECIEYLMKIEDFSNLTEEIKQEIRSKRANAASAAAAAASYASYAAASYAASAASAAASYAASYASYAVAAAAAADATYAAAATADASYAVAAADAASYARLNQKNLNIKFLKMAANK
jgi:hypothetical protein